MSTTARRKSADDSQGKKVGKTKIRRVDAAEQVLASDAAPNLAADEADECPVIRANKIVFAPAGAGRTRIVFF
ncbi:MAG: hypothetical protein JNK76_10270 [Planctomycetales bacterium]|nr:hypothetical protein [Planctomycetales bacterium]MBN8626877.1 hypothetical protein [Planctomycetota bacterium]